MSQTRRVVLLLVILVISFAYSCNNDKQSVKQAKSRSTHDSMLYARKILEASQYVSTRKNFNDSLYMLIDMNIHSGYKRYFIYELKTKKLLYATLVTHGQGRGEDALHSVPISNQEGSYCTSVGKYSIGHKYEGIFGTAYKLYGLDSSNSNAFDRFVVLHSHNCVPDEETDRPICLSQGCPTVSPTFLQEVLVPMIDHSPKSILLEIIYDANRNKR